MSREFCAPRRAAPKLPSGASDPTRPWLVHHTDPLLHYEVATLGERRGILEIGLHFESRNPAVNARLLDGFLRHLFEIKAELGSGFEAEMWDKGWTKVYETIPLEAFDEAYVDRVAGRLAQIIAALQPILEHLTADR
jgi:hypothetical protein